MAIHKLYIDDFETVNYSLIAIHSNLEDFRIAYFINDQLNLEFKKSSISIPIQTKFGESNFERFIFEDEKNQSFYNLIQNKNQIIIRNLIPSTGLFAGKEIETRKKVFLLPEYKTVDFFLKIDYEDHVDDQKLIRDLNRIDRISASYSIDINNIKNKNNLIF